TYPISSYSYMIVPTTTASPFSTDQGDTLGRFILYFLCAGQQKAKQLGYSPLPKNLVQYAFDAEKLIPGAPAPPPIDQCNNPTITGGCTTANAPQPPPQDRKNALPPPTAPRPVATTAAPRAPSGSNGGGGNSNSHQGGTGSSTPAAVTTTTVAKARAATTTTV